VTIEGVKLDFVELVLEDHRWTIVTEPVVVGQGMDSCWQRRPDSSSLDHKKIDPEVDAAPLRLTVKKRGVAVEHAVLVITPDPYRHIGPCDLFEEGLSKPRDVVDVEAGELGIGGGKIEDHDLSGTEIEVEHRGQIVSVILESGGKWRLVHPAIVAGKTRFNVTHHISLRNELLIFEDQSG